MASSSIPKQMVAIQMEKTGGTEVLQYKTDVPVPQPEEGQILVKNDFVGVNYIDTSVAPPSSHPTHCQKTHELTLRFQLNSYFRTGLYPTPSLPYILGREASGTILATGGGNTYGLKAGDRIVYMHTSTYAAYTAAPSLHALKIPDGVSSEDACAALLQGLTALTLIRESYRVQKGDWVLVHAAAGGVGLWLCQLLRAVGARTIGTASTKEKVELARKFGAEVVVDYSHEDVVQRVKEVTGGKGCAAVFDGVGKETFDVSMECLARKGTLASFGNASGAVPPLTIARLSPKNAKLLRPTLFGYLATREEFENYTSELFDFMTKDKMDVRIYDTYPLKEVARAHNDLEGRKTTGKLLLKPEH